MTTSATTPDGATPPGPDAEPVEPEVVQPAAGSTRPAEPRPDVDWELLRRTATAVAQNAYAPFSRLHVGAAGLVEDGRVVVGCNVENASYGLGLCAECGLASALHASGGGRLVAVSVVAGDGNPLAPCGRCRQVLLEHGGTGLLLDGGLEPGAQVRSWAELLPDSFGGDDITGRREADQ